MTFAHDEELVRRAQARAEFEQRRAFNNLETYIPISNPLHVCSPKFAPLYRKLDQMRAGKAIRLLLAAPPRSRKSTTVFHAAVREMTADPSFKFGYGTYNTQFAREQSTICRGMAARAGLWVSDEKVQEDPAARFDLAKSTVYWQTRAGGGGKFLGRGGAAIGSGFNLINVDDPIKTEAESEPDASANEEAWRWVVAAMLTRGDPGYSAIIGHHRWGDDDIIGRLLDRTAEARNRLTRAEQALVSELEWEYLDFPAVLGGGDPLTDELLIDETEGWFSRAELAFSRAQDDRVWSAMWMQRPPHRGSKLFPVTYPVWQRAQAPDGQGDAGLIDPISGDWYPVPDIRGKVLVLSADTAGSENDSADLTAVVLYAFSWVFVPAYQEHVIEVDVLRAWTERLESPDVVEFVAKIARPFGGNVPVVYEDKAEGRAQLRFLKQRYPLMNVVPIATDKSKRARALSYAGAARNGRVRLPFPVEGTPDSIIERDAPWLPEWLRQHKAFTGRGGRVHDDIVDAGAHAYNHAQKMAPPMKGMVGGREIGTHWPREKGRIQNQSSADRLGRFGR